MEPASTTTHAQDIERGERFEFGRNWTRFLQVLDDERIDEACKSLRRMLGIESLARRTFLDVGSGSGLFSLAAMKLGAERVFSFDFDPHSVACTLELKRRYFPGASNWTIEQGSVLDDNYLEHLGLFEVVYSWGVLHHTGNLWQALANVAAPVAPGGRLFIADTYVNDDPTAEEVAEITLMAADEIRRFIQPFMVPDPYARRCATVVTKEAPWPKQTLAIHPSSSRLRAARPPGHAHAGPARLHRPVRHRRRRGRLVLRDVGDERLNGE